MADETAEKIARNNAAFREANDRIEDGLTKHGLVSEEALPFICECSDRSCVEIIRLTMEEYERVRSNPRWFAHAVGHEESVEGIVAPVERHQSYVLVEKLDRAGDIAKRLAGGKSEE